MYVLQLFVAGPSSRSTAARQTVERLCASHLGGDYELEVVDVLAEPEKGEDASVLTTPTVVRRSPGPEVRVVGDLDDERAVLSVLDVRTSR